MMQFQAHFHGAHAGHATPHAKPEGVGASVTWNRREGGCATRAHAAGPSLGLLLPKEGEELDTLAADSSPLTARAAMCSTTCPPCSVLGGERGASMSGLGRLTMPLSRGTRNCGGERGASLSGLGRLTMPLSRATRDRPLSSDTCACTQPCVTET